MLPNFELVEKGPYASLLNEQGILNFHDAIAFVKNLPYGRNSRRTDFTLLFTEHKGTCSSKHGFLMHLCELNHVDEVSLMVGIILMGSSYHTKLEPVLEQNHLTAIPEAHCYIMHRGIRYDFTSTTSTVHSFEPFLVREQRCDSIQVGDWKPMIHKHYIEAWLKRNPQIEHDPQKIWEIREACIETLSK